MKRVLAVALLFVFACAAEETSKTPIRVGYLPVSTSLPVMLAESEGLFAKRGVTVTLERFSNSNLLISALLVGEIDATAVCADEPILSAAVGRASPPFYIYLQELLTRDRAFDTILVPSDSSVQSVRDLSGKTLAAFPGSQLRIYSEIILRHFEVDPSTVKIIQLAPPNMLPSLFAGSVDAVLALEPIGTLAIATGKARSIAQSPIVEAINGGEPLSAASFLLRASWAESNPEIADAFVRSVYDAADLIEADYPRAAALYPSFTPIPEELAGKVVITRFARIDDPDVDGLSREIELLREHGDLEGKLNPGELIYRWSDEG